MADTHLHSSLSAKYIWWLRSWGVLIGIKRPDLTRIFIYLEVIGTPNGEVVLKYVESKNYLKTIIPKDNFYALHLARECLKKT